MTAYRADDAATRLEAPTADGTIAMVLGPDRVDLSVGQRSFHVADRVAVLVEHKRKKQERRASVKIAGPVVVARGWPRESLGIWVELAEPGGPAPMQRLFGVEPANLLDGGGLTALARLDAIATRLRAHLDTLGITVQRGAEIGAGHALDKVLMSDQGDRYVVYSRKLFRDRARFTMAIHDDGRIVVPDGKKTREVRVNSKFGVTVRGDYVRFADRHGSDLAKVSVPWIGPEDRDELARRIGQRIHRE